MNAIEKTHQRLGVALPDSYLEARESLEQNQDYRWFLLEELVWFADHPMSEVIDFDGRGIVIAEDGGGNPLLLLVSDREPGDAVYHLDHDGDVLERLASTLGDLLEELGVAVLKPGSRIVSQAAFAIGADGAEATEIVTEVFKAHGYRPAEQGALEVRLSRGPEQTIAWLAEHTTGDSMLGFSRLFAKSTGARVVAIEVVVREEQVVLEEDGEWGFYTDLRVVEVDASGTRRDLEASHKARGASAGDQFETCNHLFFQELEMQGMTPTDEIARLSFKKAEELPARLQSIVTLSSEAESISLTEIAGQKAIRLVLSDGNQMSVVTDEELETLRNYLEL